MNNFKEFERLAWEQKADRYNDTWGSVTNQVIPTVLDTADIRSKDDLLDCGCGPGHLCHQAELRGANVSGCDYSNSMIEIAKNNYPTIRFFHEDAENLSFQDASFDVVILNYLLLHVSDQQKVLSEARRVLRPGGRLVFSVWLAPQESPGLKLMFDAVKQYADTSVIPPAQDIFLLANEKTSTSCLSDMEFIDINCRRFDSFWRVSSGEIFFSSVQAGTRIGGLIDLQIPAVKDQIKNLILKEIEQFKVNEKTYIIPTPSLLVSAKKPFLR